jgi:hypothetical protein
MTELTEANNKIQRSKTTYGVTKKTGKGILN